VVCSQTAKEEDCGTLPMTKQRAALQRLADEFERLARKGVLPIQVLDDIVYTQAREALAAVEPKVVHKNSTDEYHALDCPCDICSKVRAESIG
jgi:hypothetical protein